MSSQKLHTFILLLMLLKIIAAQGETAVPFLNLEQSPMQFGAGKIGTALPSFDAAGFYLNPAILGYSSTKNNASLLFLMRETNWLNHFGITFNTLSASVGYNYENSEMKIPLSVGIGFVHNKIDYGTFVRTNSYSPYPVAYYNSYDSFESLSLGVGYKYFLQFNLGVTLKYFESNLKEMATENETFPGNADGTAFDLGFLVVFPLTEIIIDEPEIFLTDNSSLKPAINFSVGTAMLNFGNEINYGDVPQSDPLPRTSRLGYNFNLLLELKTESGNFDAVNYSFTAEANDLLISRKTNNDINYQNIFGDIKFGKHLINLRGDDNVIVHRGHILKLFDSIIITSGRFHGHGYYGSRTSGIGFTTDGLFKLLANLDSSIIDFLSKHITIEYYNTDSTFNEGLVSNFQSMAIYLRGVEF